MDAANKTDRPLTPAQRAVFVAEILANAPAFGEDYMVAPSSLENLFASLAAEGLLVLVGHTLSTVGLTSVNARPLYALA